MKAPYKATRETIATLDMGNIQFRDNKILFVDNKIAMADPCCCLACDLFADDFNRTDSSDLGSDWDEVSGSWAIDTNALKVTSDNAIAITTSSYPLPITITATIDPTSSGDVARIIFNYVDSTHYKYVQVALTSASSPIRLYTRSGGSVILVKSVTKYAPYTSEFKLRVCVLSDRVQVAYYSGAFGEWRGVMNEELNNASTAVGLGTGNITTSVVWDDFAVTRHISAVPGDIECSSCTPLCNWCIDDLTPELVKIVISGITPDNGPNGTYILDPVITTNCGWFSTEKTYEVWNTCGATPNVVLISVDSGGVHLQIATDASCPTGGVWVLADWNITGDEDCMNWDDLEMTSRGVDSDFHDVTNAEYLLTTLA